MVLGAGNTINMLEDRAEYATLPALHFLKELCCPQVLWKLFGYHHHSSKIQLPVWSFLVHGKGREHHLVFQLREQIV